MSQSTVCSLRLKKRKGDSNPKGTAVRAPALQDAILHQVCGYIAPPRPGPDHRPWRQNRSLPLARSRIRMSCEGNATQTTKARSATILRRKVAIGRPKPERMPPRSCVAERARATKNPPLRIVRQLNTACLRHSEIECKCAQGRGQGEWGTTSLNYCPTPINSSAPPRAAHFRRRGDAHAR
jgi:hypothetical protein